MAWNAEDQRIYQQRLRQEADNRERARLAEERWRENRNRQAAEEQQKLEEDRKHSAQAWEKIKKDNEELGNRTWNGGNIRPAPQSSESSRSFGVGKAILAFCLAMFIAAGVESGMNYHSPAMFWTLSAGIFSFFILIKKSKAALVIAFVLGVLGYIAYLGKH